MQIVQYWVKIPFVTRSKLIAIGLMVVQFLLNIELSFRAWESLCIESSDAMRLNVLRVQTGHMFSAHSIWSVDACPSSSSRKQKPRPFRMACTNQGRLENCHSLMQN